jgi:hypothetical protein
MHPPHIHTERSRLILFWNEECDRVEWVECDRALGVFGLGIVGRLLSDKGDRPILL